VSPHRSFHYMSTDQVNAAAAEAIAVSYRISLEPAEPRDLPRLEGGNARLLLDWDCFSSEDRKRLLDNESLYIVADHGFNMGDSVSRFLSARGTLCRRRLDEQIFKYLSGFTRAA
jgi:hypothetical protein